MFRLPKEQFSEQHLAPTWDYLVKTERSLERNVRICGVLQPLGAVLFTITMALAGLNFLLFLLGEKIEAYFAKIPILPTLVSGLARESISDVIISTVLIGFILPLALCGIVAGIFYALGYSKPNEPIALCGTLAQRAQAATNKAETVYELRKKMPRWTIYTETGILTALTTLPLLLMFIDYASDSAMILSLSLILLGLLLSLFVMFWVYALCFTAFSRLNALYYFSPSEWKLYEIYGQLDAFWETVDPDEFARRQRQAELNR